MKKVLSLFCIGLMAVSLVGCGSSDKKSSTLTVGAESLTGTFSPIYYSSSYDGYAVDLVYNKLGEYDVNNKLQPGLAESWTVSDDAKSVTFKLKKGIKFSDGTDFNAKDVEFTFKVVSDPSYDGRYAGTTQYLSGYANYNNLENEEEPKFPGIKVVDDYTITFTTDEARNDSLTAYAASFAIISKEQFKDYKYKNTKAVKDLIKEPIGTGPYVMKKWDAGSGASFTKNENYSAKQLGEGYEIENVIIKPTKMTTEYQELESGNIDILAGSIEPKKIGPATNNKDLKLNSYPRGGAGYITFNAGAGVTQDKLVRQALTYAFDRQSFVDSYYECPKCKDLDGAQIGYVPTLYNNPLSEMGPAIRGEEKIEGLNTYEYNIETSKQLLDQAGWTVGADGFRYKNGEKLSIKILSMADHDILANLVPMWQKAWGTELGADVQVATVDFNTILDKIYYDKNANEWTVFFLATSYTSDGMTDIYTTFNSRYAKDGSDNYARLKNPEVDALLDKGLTTLDKEEAVNVWKEIAVKLNDEATVVPVYGNTYFDIYNKRVKNLKTNALYSWPKALKDATLE